MNTSRRQFLKTASACAASAATFNSVSATAGTKTALGTNDLYVVSDGNMSLPRELVLPGSESNVEQQAFLTKRNLTATNIEPACNLTLWQNESRLILFDVGAGPNFMETTGAAASDLESLGIDLGAITDVVLTHAHPDHFWGLIDDFDELLCPNATYYMNKVEWDFWWDENTIHTVPELQQRFAVGARNRMMYLEETIELFGYGDEVISGVEAVDTHGHTPGHTSFALHHNNNSMMVLGDALTHPILSIEQPQWRWGMDQDAEAAIATRKALLDRLAAEQTKVLGYHFPHPGLGRVERNGAAYRYVAA